jgi:acetyl esterase/lipase
MPDDASLKLDMEGESRTLLIAFGGIRGSEIGVPAFEFSAATDGLPVKRLFVRDLRQAWYHRGIPEFGSTLESVASGLADLIDRDRIERLVMAGNSAGGYAAIAFGTLLQADAVLAFAPQTVLELDALARIDDHRWDSQLAPIAAEGALDRDWSDLRRALERVGGRTRYQLFYDEKLAVDRRHAELLAGVENTRLYPFGRGGHRLVRALREAGALQLLLRRALTIPS